MRRLPTVLAFVAASAAAAADGPAPARRAELLHLVRQDCGSCHGLTLKGGLGPSLEPAALAAKDAEQMSFVILHGRRGTPMPPWSAHLSETEARWIVEQLRKGLPK
jgi:cytochrome c55X